MAGEKNFENKVKEYLSDMGAWHVKFFANRMTKIGVPDILACVNGYFVAVEVKASNGRPSDLQIYNIQKIREAGGFAVILYPSGFEQFKRFIEDLKSEKFNREMEVILK